MAGALEGQGQLHAHPARHGHPAQVIARQVHQHLVLGQLLGISL